MKRWNRPLTAAELEAEANRIMNEGLISDEEPYIDSGSSYRCSSDGSSSDSTAKSDDDIQNNVDGPNNVDDEPNNTSDVEQWDDSDFEPLDFPFMEKEGFQKNIDPETSPMEVFSFLFDAELLDKIVNWTNARAERFLQEGNLSRKSNMQQWKNITVAELRSFLGLCIIMGQVQMPSIKNYWSQQMIYKHPIFSKVMGRNRFEMILRCLCFYEANEDQQNRLHKINNVLSHLLKNFQNIYYPGPKLSIDEALLLWRGRLYFRQYIPNKAAKYGIKLYEVCTPDGYVLNMIIYSGKGTVTSEEHGHAFSVVQELLTPYIGKGHTVYIDNFYSSVSLAKYLIQKNTHVVGTLRSNRKGNPTEVVKKKLTRGESIWKRNGSITVGKWRDKRDVLVLSTCHKFDMTTVKNRKGVEHQKPNVVADYNANMSGIDRADQMISYYSTPRKTIRWYLKLFFHLMDVALWNSHFLYKKATGKKISYLNFREEVASAMVDLHKPLDDITARRNMPTQPHFPVKCNKRKRCRQCSKDRKKTLTWFVCDTCKDKEQEIGLCAHPCFANYHA